MFARTFIALAGSPFVLATPALAQMETQSKRVVFGDLDLSSDAGRAQLQRRINKAASSVCGPSSRNLSSRAAHETCRSDALADSRRQLASLNDGEENIRIAQRSAR